ncbi:methylated-DNA--[protein]-cysteine S-methyltransferase [Mesorhizobium sp. LHD-90]|uniref:methylated-DNA--[protein]-cysteine S-methyltransferase n=1 Tax=Mesorhizobium sp. LHD-90 TaxID=3071414 RepID=UPI0027DF7A63|nr:methylated-DNA--[protein]-cysteine S-methyltransferase [Mesorhizobium sp. LHD-90]MDQ6433813.1 methylated-DNA--[protein]-cysteine S-methyltransferase [Mesorhizobium sp. LHD-90]
MLSLTVQRIATPLGDMLLVADPENALRAAEFADCEERLGRLLDRRLGAGRYRLESGPVSGAAALDAYFTGDVGAIDEMEVCYGGTPFQQEVWRALRGIAPGRALTYSGLATAIGRPSAPRAVGHANGANPFSIVVPCHRLIGANGDLTGYAGGIARKRWLLDHEAKCAGSG